MKSLPPVLKILSNFLNTIDLLGSSVKNSAYQLRFLQNSKSRYINTKYFVDSVLLQNRFYPTHSGAGGFFFDNFEMSELTGS